MKSPHAIMNSTDRFAGVRVLIADRNGRTASLVRSVLFSFGFRTITLATDSDSALQLLGKERFDFIITEWTLKAGDGIALVKAIRAAKDHQRLRRDIPIIMLTARSEPSAVQHARDAGITEFLVKPFSARTLSHRLIQIIDKPRMFIDAPDYVGPCRRRRGEVPAAGERRNKRISANPLHRESPPNTDLKKQIGDDIMAIDIFTEALVAQAQQELQSKEAEFIDWTATDIAQMETAFAALTANLGDASAHASMVEMAYTIKEQAGIFGYDLGTQIGGQLVDYLESHPHITRDQLVIVRKYIDTIAVVFAQKIKHASPEISGELLRALRKLVEKLG